MESNTPKGLITPAEAKKLNHEFIKTRSKALDKIVGNLDNNTKKKDALSAWFSLEEIENYITYIKQQGKEKGIEINGLRIYFGAYGKDTKQSKKKNLSTVFIAPTTQNTSLKTKDIEYFAASDTDISPLNLGGQGDPPSAPYPII